MFIDWCQSSSNQNFRQKKDVYWHRLILTVFTRRLTVATVWTYKWKTAFSLCGAWEFPLDEFLDKIRRGWSRDAIINNF